MSTLVLELMVNNHPGVLSHVAGLFSRRAFNIEGVLCGPVGNGETSRIYLLVDEDERMAQLIKQLRKLHDVLDVRERRDYDRTIFNRLDEFAGPG